MRQAQNPRLFPSSRVAFIGLGCHKLSRRDRVLILAGGVFALQGLSLLPSRVMFGRQEWVVIGAAMVVVGVALGVLTLARARRSALKQ